MKNKSKDPRKEIICLCNGVTRKTIQDAIDRGAKTPNSVFDATTAGVGPCGGSCRKKIIEMLKK
ncbi:MAG: (2Fe-2S)-binding protein [Bdellovibrionales bacterium CG10_big_fil_rev_8_21_14_0_10_45_34]|nr:MAG: (2Fe-2S)-binding protein [Bdellovibrionales bacterium CG10_big_fil_rev_8_21_14_0_10_45_34]